MAKGRASPSLHEIPLGPGCDFDEFHDFYLAPAFRACPPSSGVAALLYAKITAKKINQHVLTFCWSNCELKFKRNKKLDFRMLMKCSEGGFFMVRACDILFNILSRMWNPIILLDGRKIYEYFVESFYLFVDHVLTTLLLCSTENSIRSKTFLINREKSLWSR